MDFIHHFVKLLGEKSQLIKEHQVFITKLSKTVKEVEEEQNPDAVGGHNSDKT